MKRVLLLSLALVALAPTGFSKAKGSRSKVKTVATPRFQSQLMAIINTANGQQGMDALKHTEIVTGVWDSKIELDGFITTIVLDQYHPADRWMVKAESVNAATAISNVRTLIQHGLRGYSLRDSDKDKTLEIDRTRHSRKVTLSRHDRYKETTITILFNAHRHNSVTMYVETHALHVAS